MSVGHIEGMVYAAASLGALLGLCSALLGMWFCSRKGPILWFAGLGGIAGAACSAFALDGNPVIAVPVGADYCLIVTLVAFTLVMFAMTAPADRLFH